MDPALLYPDYPNLTEIPETEFSCKGKVNWRYYADPDANCQVNLHINSFEIINSVKIFLIFLNKAIDEIMKFFKTLHENPN